jgi:ferric-dicitrate binding protein FerR (iron transport regulator)
MKQQTDSKAPNDREEQAMARMLRLAGPRDPIPQDVEARVYNVTEQAWRRSVAEARSARVYDNVHQAWSKHGWRGRLRRWLMPMALAASAALAAAIIMQQQAPPMPAASPAGTVARVIDLNGGADLPRPGAELYPGEMLETGGMEGISLALANAQSLRLGADTAVEILAADRFRLLRGRIYADTGDLMYRQSHLLVDTPMGAVTDIGTQFAVFSEDDRLEVAVREGRVDVSRGAAVHIAVAGELLKLHAGGQSDIEALPPHDEYWDWASALAPEFDIENKSLLDFLRWAARETGRELEFEDQGLRMSAMRTDLHGSVSGFDPLEAVESVLATTAYQYRIEDDRIVVTR